MFKLIEFLKKRPSDATIRIIRALIAFFIAFILAYFANDYILPFQSSFEVYALWVKYTIAGVFAIPGIVSALGLCVARRKIVKRMQMICGLFLFIFGISLSTVVVEAPKSTGNINAASLTTQETPKSFPVGGVLMFLAFIPLLGGATGKLVTEKCQKYGETIKKIRV